MDGFLMVPPDRGTIIGRAVWKSRYVVLGPPPRPQTSDETSLARITSSNRLHNVRKNLISAPITKMNTGSENAALSISSECWLSVYKQKGDGEIIQSIPVRSITCVEIKSVQYRKPGPTLQTLVISFQPDASMDRARRRRSSRTVVLPSSQSSFPNSLLFRSINEERFKIHDWQATLQPRIQPKTEAFEAPMSPTSPLFDSFINPFSSSGKATSLQDASRPDLHHKGSSTTGASLRSGYGSNRPNTSKLISPSPSLRSKSSDISSSQVSFLNRQQGLPIQQLPSDLPSPASTAGYDDGQSILGWTSAQGRSSALSNHTRAGSASISVVGTPPAPRETILDRAFQMRYIPGSDRVPTDDDRMSSIARFEALMKEAEDRRKSKISSASPPSKFARRRSRKDSVSGWQLDEADEDNESDSASDDEDEDEKQFGSRDSYEDEDEDKESGKDPLASSIHEMSTPAQRALEYISGRGTPIPQYRTASPAPPLPTSPIPITSRAQPIARTRTAPPVSHRQERPRSLIVTSSSHTAFLDPSTASAKRNSGSTDNSATGVTSGGAHRSNSPGNLKRSSTTSNSGKRLSFTEFARRLSSTSSLLLVQSNTNLSSQSGGSVGSRASFDEDGGGMLHRGLSQSRLSGMVVAPAGGVAAVRNGGGRGDGGGSLGYENDSGMVRGHWTGNSLGVFGGEGGFL